MISSISNNFIKHSKAFPKNSLALSAAIISSLANCLIPPIKKEYSIAYIHVCCIYFTFLNIAVIIQQGHINDIPFIELWSASLLWELILQRHPQITAMPPYWAALLCRISEYFLWSWVLWLSSLQSKRRKSTNIKNKSGFSYALWKKSPY